MLEIPNLDHMKQRVLVTGGAGYIGSVLCRQLFDAGFQVRVIDRLSFGGRSLVDLLNRPGFDFIKGDIRDAELMRYCMEGMDAVVHLAAIVGDPACKQAPEEASEIMDAGSIQLFRLAEQMGLKHFIFASTCSNYGLMDSPETLLDEEAPLQPQSHYARLKVGFEQFLLEQKDSPLPRSILRFSTVYGYSPRLRFDLTVNHFTRDLSLGKELEIFGADTWRPYCHVEDLAASVCFLLQKDPESMNGKVYNVGDSEENYSKGMIAEEIRKQIPEARIKIVKQADSDLRNYRIDFSRIHRELDYSISKRVPDGIREIHKLIQSGLIANPYDPLFQNC